MRTEFVGGGFGAKQGAGFEALAAAELARITGRPVRLVNDRHAEQLDGGRRAATRQTVRLGARRDGTLTAIDADAVIAMGQGGWVFPVLDPGPHALPLRRRARADVPREDEPPRPERVPGARRDGGHRGVRAGDRRARARARPRPARAAPPQPRRRRPGERAAVLEQAAPRLLRPRGRARRLGRPRASCGRRSADGLLRGMGCATQIWWGGGGPPSHATVRLDADGHARVVTGIQDIGTGTLTAAQIVAAEELGLPLDHVRVVGGDTRAERLRPGRRRLPDDAVGDARRAVGRRRRCARRCSSSPATSSRSPPATSRSRTAGSARTTARSTPT